MGDWQDPVIFNIWLAIVTGFVLTLIVSMVLFIRMYYKRIMADQEVLADTQLGYQKKLAESSVLTLENERNRVAVELHDNLISKINVALFAMKTVQAESPHYGILEEVIHTARRISHDLRPPLIEDNSVAEVVYALVSPIKSAMDFEFWHRTDEGVELSRKQKLLVTRIVQETTNNMLKHAKATEVTIQLRISEHLFSMAIVDNGVGFNPDEAKGGLGMQNIELHMQILRGKYRFRSKPGRTSLVFAFPHQELPGVVATPW